MIEAKRNIWHWWDAGHVVCFTTNGYVKSSFAAVMGRGTAAQAMRIRPGIEFELGARLMLYGNHVQVIAPRLVSFPVKPVEGIRTQTGDNVVRHMRRQFSIGGEVVPGWAMKADLPIIERSLKELAALAWDEGWPEVLLPRPGCGAGELKWSDVRPICAQYGDWLVVVTL